MIMIIIIFKKKSRGKAEIRRLRTHSQLDVSSFFYLEAHLENSPSCNHIIKMPIKTLV